MAINLDFFESIAKEIEGKFRRINALLNRANLKSGEYHEVILREALQNFLSDRFTIKTGYIYLDDNNHSKQIDILIIDESHPFTYIFKERDFVIVRPEAVVAVIEVKTKLKQNELREGFENIFTAKKLKHQSLGYYGHIYGIVFGYSTNALLTDILLDKWFKDPILAKYESEVEALWPNAFFFFSHGLLLQLDSSHHFDKETGPEHFYKIYRNHEKKDTAWQLGLLIATIVSMCEGATNSQLRIMSPFKATNMIDFSEANFSTDRFRPGEGHSVRV